MLHTDHDLDPPRSPRAPAVVIRVAEKDEAAARDRGRDVVRPRGRKRAGYRFEWHVGGHRTERGRGDALGQVGGWVCQPDREPVAAGRDSCDVLRLAGHVGRGADHVGQLLLPGPRAAEAHALAWAETSLDRVLERLRSDELVRRRREAQSLPDHEGVGTAAVADGRLGAGGVGHGPHAGRPGLVGVGEQRRADRILDRRVGDRVREGGIELRDVRGQTDHERAACWLRRRLWLDAHPHLVVRDDERLGAAADSHLCGRPARAFVDTRERSVPGVRHPDAPSRLRRLQKARFRPRSW